MSDKERELSEDAAWEISLKYHPEWRRATKRGKLPEEIVTESGETFKPRVHLMMHAIVERQLAVDRPPGVVAIAQQLEQLGLSQHDIRHEIGRAISEQMWFVLQQKRVFDEAQYLTQLQAIVAGHRRARLRNPPAP